MFTASRSGLWVWQPSGLGTKILPKLRSGSDLKVGLEFSVTVIRRSSELGVGAAPDSAGTRVGGVRAHRVADPGGMTRPCGEHAIEWGGYLYRADPVGPQQRVQA